MTLTQLFQLLQKKNLDPINTLHAFILAWKEKNDREPEWAETHIKPNMNKVIDFIAEQVDKTKRLDDFMMSRLLKQSRSLGRQLKQDLFREEHGRASLTAQWARKGVLRFLKDPFPYLKYKTSSFQTEAHLIGSPNLIPHQIPDVWRGVDELGHAWSTWGLLRLWCENEPATCYISESPEIDAFLATLDMKNALVETFDIVNAEPYGPRARHFLMTMLSYQQHLSDNLSKQIIQRLDDETYHEIKQLHEEKENKTSKWSSWRWNEVFRLVNQAQMREEQRQPGAVGRKEKIETLLTFWILCGRASSDNKKQLLKLWEEAKKEPEKINTPFLMEIAHSPLAQARRAKDESGSAINAILIEMNLNEDSFSQTSQARKERYRL